MTLSFPPRLVLGACIALAAAPALAGSFTAIDVANGQVTGLSHNGRIVNGIAGASAWRWSADRGALVVDGMTGAAGASSWSQPFAGSATDGDGNEVAALAYGNSHIVGPTVLGGLPGAVALDGMLSSAWGVSDDGTAVGLAYAADGTPSAFRWTAAAGMATLPVQRPANASRANGISGDGSTIFGWNDQDNGARTAVVWRNGVAGDLVAADGELPGEALAANHDGSVVVGASLFNAETGASEAWRWTAATGVEPIGFLGMMGTAFAFGTSDDGDVVVGASGFGFNRSAVVWTPGSGMVLLADHAAAHGVTIPAGWTLITASAVSADGLTIAGWGLDPSSAMRSFVVDLHGDPATEAVVEAHGTVAFNDLADGPYAGVAGGSAVTMTFRITTVDATEFDPGQATRYRIVPGSFTLQAGSATDTLAETSSGPAVIIANDYPMSDGIHLMESPMATAGQSMEFELFNPGGNLFDSDDLDRINRTFGPELFEKVAWFVAGGGGEQAMMIELQSVGVHDAGGADAIFADGFD